MSDVLERGVSRRRWLVQSAAVAGVVAAAPLMTNCGGGSMSTGPVDAGAVTAYSVGTFLTVGPLIVARDAMGLYAYSNVCTHQGCTVPVPTMGVSTCPCHLSHFDANGNVQPGGMATMDLPHYPVMINSGRVMVDISAPVADRTIRTPVA